ncbi:MAG TPA: winged helix-turn-helix domain-containing protein [Chryseolinea sp.]|nr:winged helix-turn-helix domain-containing protein [Chryseolinea sp.]
MRVNSVFTSFFSHRFVVRYGIAIILLAIFLIASSFTKHSDRDLQAKQVNLIIRDIGHRLLLQSGDVTSRVLPVTETKEGTFRLILENEFVFNHDSLMVMTQELFPKNQFPSGYTVTVLNCRKADIVYGFQVNNSSPSILPCSGRSESSGCYLIEFTFPDFYENYPYTHLVYSGMLLLLGVTLLVGRFGKTLTPTPLQNQDHTITQEHASELLALGEFLFDVKGQRLVKGGEVISLTDKECKILELLNHSFGELITRETLMQKIWIDEGVITGRSLDMFVSKLRKKLSSDPQLKITNVHGKGYKLEDGD